MSPAAAGDGEEGTVAVMILGFLTVILLVVALTVDSSSYFLARRDAQAFCDRLALADAREQGVDVVLRDGARSDGQPQRLVPKDTTNANGTTPEVTAARDSRPDIQVSGPTYSDGHGHTGAGVTVDHVTWTCTEHVRPPFTGAFRDDGFPVTATSTAITSTATAGG